MCIPPHSLHSFTVLVARVAKVARTCQGPLPKNLDSDGNLSPNIRYFVAKLRFVAMYTIFGRLWAIKCFLSKKCTITWYILHIILHLITRKNDAFVAKIANTRLTKNFVCEQPLWQIFFALSVSMKRRSPKIQTCSTQVPSSALNRRSRTMTLIEGKNIFEFL